MLCWCDVLSSLFQLVLFCNFLRQSLSLAQGTCSSESRDPAPTHLGSKCRRGARSIRVCKFTLVTRWSTHQESSYYLLKSGWSVECLPYLYVLIRQQRRQRFICEYSATCFQPATEADTCPELQIEGLKPTKIYLRLSLLPGGNCGHCFAQWLHFSSGVPLQQRPSKISCHIHFACCDLDRFGIYAWYLMPQHLTKTNVPDKGRPLADRRWNYLLDSTVQSWGVFFWYLAAEWPEQKIKRQWKNTCQKRCSATVSWSTLTLKSAVLILGDTELPVFESSRFDMVVTGECRLYYAIRRWLNLDMTWLDDKQSEIWICGEMVWSSYWRWFQVRVFGPRIIQNHSETTTTTWTKRMILY